MPPRYLEDLEIGEVWHTGTVEATAAMLQAFAHSFDPQPMHTDPHAARDSYFATHIGSGWHAACLTMRLVVESKPLGDTALIGVEVGRIRFLRPFLPESRLTAQAVVTATRPLASKPGYGLAHVDLETHDQSGLLLTMSWTLLVPCRP